MIDQLRAFTYERQRLGQAAPNAARALKDVIAVYSSHPSAPLSLHARAKKMTGAQFRKLDVLRLPAMRMSIHLLPAKTAHLAFHATPAPPADRKKRMKHFKFTEKRYEELRKQILKAATEPLTLPELREKVGAEPNEFKGVSAQMTRDGELLRDRRQRACARTSSAYVANELERRRRRRGAGLARRRVPARLRADPRQGLHVVGRRHRRPAPSRRSPTTTPRSSTAAC